MTSNEELEEILRNRRRYHWKPRAWKLQHPAYHSCMRCKHRDLMFLPENKPILWCPIDKCMHSKIALYYPNECERFEERV